MLLQQIVLFYLNQETKKHLHRFLLLHISLKSFKIYSISHAQGWEVFLALKTLPFWILLIIPIMC